MTPEELHAEWHDGEETGMRPQRIQQERDLLAEITGMFVPRRISEIEGWISSMKPQITRKINLAVEEEDVSNNYLDQSDEE